MRPPLLANKLLAAMPEATVALLDRKWLHVPLAQGHTCIAAGDPIRQVYFPTSGLMSLVISTEKGEYAEVGMVGREGAVGLQSAFGPFTSFTNVVVQVTGAAYAVGADVLREAVHRDEQAQSLLTRYISMSWSEAQQLCACNAVHDASHRLARWLLQCSDRVGGDEVRLTQEFLSEMLAIRRTSVTLLAQKLGAQGIIKYSRGKITIIDRAALETRACECYRRVNELHRTCPGATEPPRSISA